MVRAILDGRKTQTRRLVTPQPVLNLDSDDILQIGRKENRKLGYFSGSTPYRWSQKEQAPTEVPCPCGQRGDRLWVRETFVTGHEADEYGELETRDENDQELPERVWYRADGEDFIWYDAGVPVDRVPWKPSIHMPRWASRITLEVTGVRVERLQDINEYDAIEEGIQPFMDTGYHVEEGRHYSGSAAASFLSLWESLNGDGSVEANPWVWVVTFKRWTQPV